MLVNNFELILPHLIFNDNNEDVFYFSQIIKRKKDNAGMVEDSKTIKSYYFKSKEGFLHKKTEIALLCEEHNARAMINLSPRSFKTVALRMLEEIASRVRTNNCGSMHGLYDSVCGQEKGLKEHRTWIIDIDEDELKHLAIYRNIPTYKIVLEVPTKSGVHLIVKPFDRRPFSGAYPDVDIHENNPTLLYYRG